MCTFSGDPRKGTVLIYNRDDDEDWFTHLEVYVLMSDNSEFSDVPSRSLDPAAFRGFEVVFHYIYGSNKVYVLKNPDEWVLGLRQIANFNRKEYLHKHRLPYTDYKVAVERIVAAKQPLESEKGFDLEWKQNQ